MADTHEHHNLALYCDFENIALGVRDAKYSDFDISHILERLLVKGSIVVKKAYCDWARYKQFKAPMHEAAFELIDIPHVRQSGKNSADIRMVVDALDLCYTKLHVDTFVIISGDSDFSPLVSKLRENAKTVIGVGVKNSTSDLLISNCDEFIYYDDLVRELEKKKPARRRSKKRSSRGGRHAKANGNGALADADAEADNDSVSRAESASYQGNDGQSIEDQALNDASHEESDQDSGQDDAQDELTPEELAQEGIDLVLEVAMALFAERGDQEKLWGSMVKQTLKRRKPGFNESYYGFDSFSKLLEEAEARKNLTLEHDDRSGGYIISRVNQN